MKMMLKATVMIPLLMGGFVGAAVPGADAERHFALSKSAPAADVSVETVSEIRLWFTEAPQEGTTSIRLIGSDDEAINAADVAQDPEDDRVFFVELNHPLERGTYTVSWRGMGDDGHVVRETFGFTVTGQ